MRKIIKSFFVCSIALMFLCIPQFVEGFYLDLMNFTTDKENYYMYENIKINAEWELYYDTENEVSFVQVQIFDNLSNLIWYSDEISQTGHIFDDWAVYIPDLNLNLSSGSTHIYIKFYHLIDDGEKIIGSYREILEIRIIKSDLTCELINFKNSIIYGENVSFSIRFFETGNNTFLNNETVLFKIKSAGKSIFTKKFNTSQFGILYLNLSSFDHLKIGINNLEFIVNESNFYDPTYFIYEIEVLKIPIIVDIIRCDNLKDNSNLISIEILYSYIYDESLIFLSNRTIAIRIFQNFSLREEYVSSTNSNGSLIFEVSYESLNLDKKLSEINIKFSFNGSYYLERTETNLSLNLEFTRNSETFNLLGFFSISGFIALMTISGIIIANKRSNREKSLADLSVKV